MSNIFRENGEKSYVFVQRRYIQRMALNLTVRQNDLEYIQQQRFLTR